MKISIIFFLLLIVMLIYYYKSKNNIYYNILKFENDDIKGEFKYFIENVKKIYLKNNIKGGDIEFSSKITNNGINSSRVVFFLPIGYLNSKLINNIKSLDYSDYNVIDKIIENINNKKYDEARFGLGYDDEEKTMRIYLSYKYKEIINLIGYNIKKYNYIEKKYNFLSNKTSGKEKIKNIIILNHGKNLYKILIDIFPEYYWDTFGTKIEKNYENVYIGFNSEYILNQFEKKIRKLLYYFYIEKNENIKNNEYNKNDKYTNIEKWIKKYCDKNIIWICLGKDYKNRESITFYFVYNKNIRNNVNEKLIKMYNKINKILK